MGCRRPAPVRDRFPWPAQVRVAHPDRADGGGRAWFHRPAGRNTMRRNALLAFLGAGALVGLAACGSVSAAPAGAGKGTSIAVSLKVVPTIRSVTITPAKAKFGDCIGGNAGLNTAPTSGALGYPNGHCWLGRPKTAFPITITNTGIAPYMDGHGPEPEPSARGTHEGLRHPR